MSRCLLAATIATGACAATTVLTVAPTESWAVTLGLGDADEGVHERSLGLALDGSRWDGIYVGRQKGDEFIYAGAVDHGFECDHRRQGSRRSRLRGGKDRDETARG
ncbi:hypothetical protein ACVWXL_000295 [Bradyrhizobium sp. GM22.5]